MAAVGFGLTRLWAYENAPGTAAAAPANWPSGSGLPTPRGRATLVVLMHPQCSCSQATVAELARLHARVRGALDTYVVMLSPSGMALDWVHSPLWRDAAAIPGVRVVSDDGGREATRFGAYTSGQALLYDGRGRLQFSGGITASRGHEGDNAGRSAIEAFVRHEPVDQTGTLVFGCGLFAPSSDIRRDKDMQ